MYAARFYHFWFLFLECADAFAPAQHTPLGPHQVTADLMETLLLLSGPAQQTTQVLNNTSNSRVLYPARQVYVSIKGLQRGHSGESEKQN